MKNFKLLTAFLLTVFISFNSCQDEIDNENGENPNTNSESSPTANNLERSSMYDGSFDDFLDGVSCSSILFPVTATINNTEITLISQADYQLVLNILGQFTNDDDSIEFQFPLSVKLSNYTEVQVANQTEYDALINACETAENEGKDAINCINIDFPITILTYNLSAQQTGSVVIESEQQLYTYMSGFGQDELFSINYPITATLNGESNTVVELTSDVDLQNQITNCLENDDAEEEAEANAEAIENILIDGKFKVESFIDTGVNKANSYADYTIDFANDLSCKAENVVNTALNNIEGTYTVTSELEVFINITFTGNTTFELLNNSWEVTNYSQSSISLQSSTNTALTLVLTRI